jgi:hypothetical protein
MSNQTTRVTITLSLEAADWLNDQARQRAISMSELVRRIVDEVRGAYLIKPRITP